MQYLARGLQRLGFVQQVDCVIQDDGGGPYIREWLIDAPRPTLEEIEAAALAFLRERLTRQVSEECRRRIYAQFSIEDQLNGERDNAWIEAMRAHNKVKAAEIAGLDIPGCETYDIYSGWPSEPITSPATGGVFDSGPTPIEEIREAYEDSHTDNEGAGDVGLAEHSSAVDSGDGGELVEAPADDPAGGGPDYSAEPVGDDSEPAEPGAYPGVMVTGDPLKAAQMELTWAVGDKEDELISVYPADENLARLNELRGIALAIKEGVHPAFDEETAAELQALETFASWLSAVRTNADRLRNAIRQAADDVALGLIDINSGWPE